MAQFILQRNFSNFIVKNSNNANQFGSNIPLNGKISIQSGPIILLNLKMTIFYQSVISELDLS